MAFDPSPYLMNLKGKQYLPVQARLLWFREEHPNGDITTELVRYHEEDKMWVVRALVTVPGGGQATGHKQETERDFPAGALEKAETGAIGRALAALGYGTAYALELDEGERLADSPAQPAKATATKTKAAPQSAENERQQAVRLNARITALCTALAIDPPQDTSGLAALGQSFGWPLAGTGAASATWKEQLIVRLEGEQARRVDEVAHPASADTEASSPTSDEPWTEPDVLNALAAAANADELERIAVEIITAHGADTLTDDAASALSACVDLAERAFKATTAGLIAQVEIDAKASTLLTVEQYDAVVALTRRVRAMRGWAGSNGSTSRQAATAGAGAR